MGCELEKSVGHGNVLMRRVGWTKVLQRFPTQVSVLLIASDLGTGAPTRTYLDPRKVKR